MQEKCAPDRLLCWGIGLDVELTRAIIDSTIGAVLLLWLSGPYGAEAISNYAETNTRRSLVPSISLCFTATAPACCHLRAHPSFFPSQY